MFILFFSLPVAAHLIISVADSVPKIDVTPSCRAAAANAKAQANPSVNAKGKAQVQANPSPATDRMKTCLDSEKKIHDQLVKEWSNFPPADRARCIKATELFSPTYTELISCLEMTRDANKL